MPNTPLDEKCDPSRGPSKHREDIFHRNPDPVRGAKEPPHQHSQWLDFLFLPTFFILQNLMFNSTVDYIYNALARHDRTVDYIHTALARHDRADLVQQYIYLNVMINYYFFFVRWLLKKI